VPFNRIDGSGRAVYGVTDRCVVVPANICISSSGIKYQRTQFTRLPVARIARLAHTPAERAHGMIGAQCRIVGARFRLARRFAVADIACVHT
jgi:hypothetical protein